MSGTVQIKTKSYLMVLKTKVTNMKIYTELEFRTRMRPQILKCLSYKHEDQIKVLNTQVTLKAQCHMLVGADLGVGTKWMSGV